MVIIYLPFKSKYGYMKYIQLETRRKIDYSNDNSTGIADTYI